MFNSVVNHSKLVVHDLDHLLSQLQSHPIRQISPVDTHRVADDTSCRKHASQLLDRSLSPPSKQPHSTSSNILDPKAVPQREIIQQLLLEIKKKSPPPTHSSRLETTAPSIDILYNSIKRSPPPNSINGPHSDGDRPRHTYDLLRKGTLKSPEDIKSRNAYLSLSPTQLTKESKANIESLLAELSNVIHYPKRRNSQTSSEIESIEATMSTTTPFRLATPRQINPSFTNTPFKKFYDQNDEYLSQRLIDRASKSNTSPITLDCQHENVYSCIPETNLYFTQRSSNLDQHLDNANSHALLEVECLRHSVHNASDDSNNLDDMLGRLEKDLRIKDGQRAAEAKKNRASNGSIPDDKYHSTSTNTVDAVLLEGHGPGLTCYKCKEIIVDHSIHALGRDWHPEHFICMVCGTEIGTGNFFEFQDMPFCERDYHERFSPKCAGCKEPILEKCVTALDRTWHPEHFRCSGTCGRIFDPGEPYHVISKADLDKEAIRAEGRSSKAISTSSNGCRNSSIADDSSSATKANNDTENEMNRLSTASNRLTDTSLDYQDKQFTNLSLVNDQPIDDLNNLSVMGNISVQDHSNHKSDQQYAFCREDYFALFAPQCRACLNPILENFVSALDSKWHPDCFVCHDCHMPFGKGSFYEYRVPASSRTNKQFNSSIETLNSSISSTHISNVQEESWPLCQTHYEARRTGSSICFGCGREIAPNTKSVTALFKKFHPEHFVCAFCLKQLTATFKERKGKPYCHTCFEKLM